MLARCITIPLMCLSLEKSLIKPNDATHKPNIAPTSNDQKTIKATLITCNKALKSFHSNLYFPSILKNCFTFSIVSPLSVRHLSFLRQRVKLLIRFRSLQVQCVVQHNLDYPLSMRRVFRHFRGSVVFCVLSFYHLPYRTLDIRVCL